MGQPMLFTNLGVVRMCEDEDEIDCAAHWASMHGTHQE